MALPMMVGNNTSAPSGPSPQSPTPTTDYWREACEQLAKEDADAWAVLEPYLPTSSNPHQSIVEKISLNIEEAQKLREANHPHSEKAKKWLESGVELIQKFSSTISAVAAMNPYASIAWSAVSATLPILLVPKNENKVAMEGVQRVMSLIYIYRTREASFTRRKLREPAAVLPNKLKDLYVSLLLYEVALLQHRGAKKIKRLFVDLANHGQWQKRNDELNRLDAEFTAIWESELKFREDRAREEEADWRREQRMRIEDEKLLQIISFFDTDYYAIKRTKERKGTRVDGTCGWFLCHSQYSKWQATENAAILWVSAGPGSGKSVLSLFLFDARDSLLKTRPSDQPIFCYYFFSSEFPNTNNAATCLKALIHQILLQDSSQCRFVEKLLRGRDWEQAMQTYDTLWEIFVDLVAVSQIGDRQVICVVDALDECELEPDDQRRGTREAFLDGLVALYSSKHRRSKSSLKMVVTSRPYEMIEGAFVPLARRLENLRLRGEDESAQIQEEISKVIRVRVRDLARKKKLTKKYRDRLIQKLNSYNNRTYLWLYLVLDYIKKELLHKSSHIDELVQNLPASVEAAYEHILNNCTHKWRARVLLSLILAAEEPMTPVQAWVALESSTKLTRRYSDIFPTQRDRIESHVTSICGLLLCVVDGKVTFIHQTVRDFLLDETRYFDSSGKRTDTVTTVREIPTWKGSFGLEDCRLRIGAACVRRILAEALPRTGSASSQSSSPAVSESTSSDSDSSDVSTEDNSIENASTDEPADTNLTKSNASSETSASSARESLDQDTEHRSISADDFLRHALKYWYVYYVHVETTEGWFSEELDDLCELIIDQLLPNVNNLRDDCQEHLVPTVNTQVYDLRAVNAATGLALIKVLEFSKRRGVDFAIYNEDGIYPIVVAAISRHIDTVEWLLKAGADINAKSEALELESESYEKPHFVAKFGAGLTALNAAIQTDDGNMIDFLLDKGASVGCANDDGLNAAHQIALHSYDFHPSRWGGRFVGESLSWPLDTYQKIDSEAFQEVIDRPDRYGQTPLFTALEVGNWAAVQKFITAGARLTSDSEDALDLILTDKDFASVMDLTEASRIPETMDWFWELERFRPFYFMFISLTVREDVDQSRKDPKGRSIQDIHKQLADASVLIWGV